jgi:hypothetical protein
MDGKQGNASVRAGSGKGASCQRLFDQEVMALLMSIVAGPLLNGPPEPHFLRRGRSADRDGRRRQFT